MSYVNYKRPTELQGGPVICGQGFGLDHGDQGGTSRVGHDGQALRLYSEDITLNSPVEQSAPFGVVLQPKIALTANQATLAGLLTLDGVLLAAGDIVLATAQSTTHQNGPWVINANDSAGAATAWTRPKLPLFSGQQYHVQAGTESGKTWRLSTVGAIVLGSTALAYDRMTTGGAGSAFDQTAITSNLAFVKEAAHTVTVGASTTAAAAGGALSLAAGAGATTGAGGAISLTAGAGGNDAVGGAASLVGGAAGGGNRAGGAAVLTGGAGAGTAAGGAAGLTGGVGGATGAGGAITLTGGAGGATSGTGGALAFVGGAGSAGNANGGAITLDGGAKNGSGADGTITMAGTRGDLALSRSGGKIGLFGATPAVQPSSVGETAGFTTGAGTAAKDDSTFTGNTGSKAYTIGDIVKHLKVLGILASS